jgi:hypothetical protein
MKRSSVFVLVAALIVSLFAINTAFSAAARGPAAKMRREMTRSMKEMGMSPEMMLRCRMLMHANVSRSNPSSLLAAKADLKLSKDQVAQLAKIVEEARTKAREVLTEEQRAKVDALPGHPASGMEMHREMMSLTKGKDMKCPMMEAIASTRPAAGEAKDKE